MWKGSTRDELYCFYCFVLSVWSHLHTRNVVELLVEREKLELVSADSVC